MNQLPFKEITKSQKRKIRKFSSDIDESELKWHYDLEDRLIVPLADNDWKIQIDNKLPEDINKSFFIKAKEWHRVIKGKSDLVVEVFFIS